MAFKDEVRKKIPKRLQTRDFKVFSDMITKKSLNSYDKLKAYLNKREIDLKDWIKKNTASGSTMNRWMAPKKSELDFIRYVKKTYLKYLR